MTGDELRNAALEYAGRGWAVFPLHTPANGGCSCRQGKACRRAGKHPRNRHGLREATTDEAQIQAWCKEWPDVNIGVVTGARSGLVVLDVDDKADGRGSRSLAALEQQHGELPDTLVSTTGSGRHLYFRHPGRPIKNSAGVLGPGLDVRGDGGYVVAPPSMHANGKSYTWVDSKAEPAELPAWLASLLVDRKPDKSSVAGGVAIIPIGSRNNDLTRIGGSLRAQGADQATIEAELGDINSTHLEEPLPRNEVRSIAASVSRYAPGALNLPWFQFYPTDWFASNAVRFGKDFQRGWLIQLVAECWRRGGALPNDPELLWQIAGATSRRAFERDGRHLLVLGQFEPVELQNGNRILVHPWLALHYQEQARKYRHKCAASAKGVAARQKWAPATATQLEGEPEQGGQIPGREDWPFVPGTAATGLPTGSPDGRESEVEADPELEPEITKAGAVGETPSTETPATKPNGARIPAPP